MIKNELEKTLSINREKIAAGERVTDVLITGPTGCGKTAMVREWLSTHDKDIKSWNWFANCYPHAVKVMLNAKGQKTKCSPWVFDTKTIEEVNNSNAVLVIDHFDLTDDEVRAQMISLVRDREVFLYTGEKQKLDKGPLMIIAIAFDNGGFGYSPMSALDKNAFGKVIHVGY